MVIYSWLCNLFFILGAPFIILICLLNPKWRQGLWPKYGFTPKLQIAQNGFWLHAVSFGEVKTIEPLIKALQNIYPETPIYLSTGTKTGQDLGKKLFENILVFYCPFDFSLAINAWLKFLKPQALFIAETEIWPELLFKSAENRIPVFLINGRLTDKSIKKYKLIKPLIQKALKSFSKILVQTQADRERFLQIGASQKQIEVLGNLKFDSLQKISEPAKQALKQQLSLQKQTIVLIAGSTHSPEEEIICGLFKKLLNYFPQKDLRLILAPRHLERLSAIETICQKENLFYQKKSQIDNFKTQEVLLLDTMGELTNLYAVCHLAFLGGTWAKVGGHNPLEPANYQLPIFVGPHTYKIAELAEQLKEIKLMQQIEDPNLLFDEVCHKINNLQFETGTIASPAVLKRSLQIIQDYLITIQTRQA